MNEIPHIIHYCWFGEKPLPEQYKKYVNTWKENFPGYKIVKWDESNFPINQYEYAEEAMEAGKMAFVSDVARVHALYKYGGIYFDTDVEVIKNFTTLLKGQKAVIGIEDEYRTIGTGFLAFTEKHPVCAEMLNYYKNNSFITQSESMSNTQILAALIKEKYNTELSNKMQKFDDLSIYPSCYFTAFNGFVGKSEPVAETCCIHHFSASWHSPIRKIKNEIKRNWHRILWKLGVK